VSYYSVEAQSTLAALIKVAGDFRLPMGIEWIKPAESGQHIVRSWQGTTAREILRELAAAKPGYEVTVSGAVVHVEPPELRSDLRNILNAPIGDFVGENQYIAFASESLEGLAAPPYGPTIASAEP
jgi:hypothetical protein